MQKNNVIAGVVLTLLLLFFAVGVAHLFILRFETGDVYPAYSSLRSDPLGTRALYESLENIDRVAVHRNFDLLKSLTFEPRTTYFFLGTSVGEFDSVPKEMLEIFDRLTRSGARLVLSFLPVTKKLEPETKKYAVEKKGSANHKSLKKYWGIGVAFKEYLPVKDDKHLSVEATSNRRGLPSSISWHTNLYFNLFNDDWQILYSYEGLPLIVERTYGKGSILMCADSFFVSNEALWSERHPQLLVWLIGGNSQIIFDETHLGIYKQPSVAQLIRRYRFHWFFIALVVLAILFIWKSVAYFVPPLENDVPNGVDLVSGKDYNQGLIALLRRNIARHQILQICANEWKQSFQKSKRIREVTVERLRALVEVGSTGSNKRRNPVKDYREISKLISEEKGYE